MCEKWITYNINHVFPTKTKCQNILNFIVQFINKHSIIHPQNYITISILTCKICRFIKPIGNVHNVSTWKIWTFERSHIPCPDILRDSEVQETYQLCFFLKFGCCPIAFFLFSRLRKKNFSSFIHYINRFILLKINWIWYHFHWNCSKKTLNILIRLRKNFEFIIFHSRLWDNVLKGIFVYIRTE